MSTFLRPSLCSSPSCAPAGGHAALTVPGGGGGGAAQRKAARGMCLCLSGAYIPRVSQANDPPKQDKRCPEGGGGRWAAGASCPGPSPPPPPAHCSSHPPPPLPPVLQSSATTHCPRMFLNMTRVGTRRGGAGAEDGGVWTAKTVKGPPQQRAQPPIRQLLGAAGAQTAHPATFSTAPAHRPLGSANAEMTPAGAPAAAADRTQRPDATCEGKDG